MREKASLSCAKALLLLTKEDGTVSKTRDEFRQVASFLDSEEGEELLSFLSSHSVPKEKQRELYEKTLSPLVSSKHLNAFFLFLLSNRLFGDVLGIEERFRVLASEELGILEGLVYSVLPLSEEQIGKIESSLSERLKKEVTLQNRIDKRLIGGVRVYVGNKMYDASLEGKMESLRERLLKGA